MKKFYDNLILISNMLIINCTNIINGTEILANNNILISKQTVVENVHSTFDNSASISNQPHFSKKSLINSNQYSGGSAKSNINIISIKKDYEKFYANYKYYADVFSVLREDINMSMNITNNDNNDFNVLFNLLNIQDSDTQTNIKQIILNKKSYNFYHYWLKRTYNNIDKLYGDLISFQNNYIQYFSKNDYNRVETLLSKLSVLADSIKECKDEIKKNQNKLNNEFDDKQYYELVKHVVKYKSTVKRLMKQENTVNSIGSNNDNQDIIMEQLTLLKKLRFIINIYESWILNTQKQK